MNLFKASTHNYVTNIRMDNHFKRLRMSITCHGQTFGEVELTSKLRHVVSKNFFICNCLNSF